MRQRAAILIGVRKTGQLQPLSAVASGIGAIQVWIEAQPGFRAGAGASRVITLSDDAAAVTAQAIRKAVKDVIDLGVVEQLFIYFAGHGVNMRFAEYWLLSGAPDDPNEAVNVRSSADLARYCGIPHVVFISDACRTAADSIQAQAVEGTVIFPNPGPNNEPGCVDLFYASMVGRPALEVRDPAAAAQAFEAVYTAVLVRGLSGKAAELVEPAGTPAVGRIRPWPLKTYLQREVPSFLLERGAALSVSQKPDAIITSAPDEWLAELPALSQPAPVPPAPPDVIAPAPAPRPSGMAMPGAHVPARGVERESVAGIAQQAVRAAMRGKAGVHSRAMRSIAGAAAAGASSAVGLFARMRQRVADTPAPHHYETQCGFEVHGCGVELAAAWGAQIEILGDERRLLRVTLGNSAAANVLIQLFDGRGMLIPAIAGHIGAITYDETAREVSSLEYEPSDNTDLHRIVAARLPALRELRRTIAAAAALGSFRIETDADLVALLEKMRSSEWVDPAMALYLAYAMHDSGQREAIETLSAQLNATLGCGLFDLALLARRPAPQPEPLASGVFPPVPLLSQGWGLLDGFNVALPAGLASAELKRHVTDSLWTLFDPQGVALIRAAIDAGDSGRRRADARGDQRRRDVMTRELILVHGRAQQDKDSIALKREWLDCLRAGLAKSGLQLPIPEDKVRFPYYGDTLHGLSTNVPDDQVAEVIVRGNKEDPQLRAFMADVLDEIVTRKGITDQQIEAQAQQALRARGNAEVIERGVLNWGWVQGILCALDTHVPGASGASIAIATTDVYYYLTNAAVRAKLDTGVQKAIAANADCVVVSHSLGTVVAYNILRREGAIQGWRVPLFVTLGSPLAVKKIRTTLAPNKHPECVGKWFNAMDPDDVVSLYPLDSTYFPLDREIENKLDVDNDTPNQHGISGYLSDKAVAKRIYEALVAP
ncbi:MAG: hypothetical protein IT531_03810 [Burkholderiales bacterium]|nr:hypothetical protein [Burkholderiales bacterium]